MKILQHLFQKDSLHEVPLEALEQFTKQYPYFPIGHFLLTKKMQDVSDAAYQEHFQKTLVYFHNPLWLQYQLRATINTHAGETANVIVDIPATLHNQIEDVIINPESESINYQALHTVDYFASQGIRINTDVKPDENDKLGKQLKSFTEWLKTMRRLPESKVQEVLQNTNDIEVDQYAATSLEENEVLTEAMAEVLVKQGNYERASGVYAKLSLLNPQKRAYFATKLEALKKH